MSEKMGDKKTHKRILTPNRTKGIFLVLIAWIFFTMAIALSRFASERSSVPIVLLFQNVLSLLVLTPWVINKGKKAFRLTRYRTFFIRSIAGYLSFAFTFLAVQRASLVNVVLLSNSAPLFIPIIIWIWRKVKIPLQLWLGILVGFLGIGVILKPNSEIVNIGGLFAIGAAISFALSMILQRRLLKTERIYTILFYYFLVSSVISIPFALDTWVPIDRITFLYLLGTGSCFICGQLCFLSSLRYEKPSFLSAFNYSAVIYGALIEYLIWKQHPGILAIFGILIVCTGSLITIFQGKDPPTPTSE